MARKVSIEYPGAIYHVMNRGDRREAIFHEDKDRELFLTALAEGCAKANCFSTLRSWRLCVRTPVFFKPRRRGAKIFSRGKFG